LLGSHTHAEGAFVEITTAPASGYTFDHWSGACSGEGACQVTMDADQFVTAHFAKGSILFTSINLPVIMK
jgi:hypothetical protein